MLNKACKLNNIKKALASKEAKAFFSGRELDIHIYHLL